MGSDVITVGLTVRIYIIEARRSFCHAMEGWKGAGEGDTTYTEDLPSSVATYYSGESHPLGSSLKLNVLSWLNVVCTILHFLCRTCQAYFEPTEVG